MAAGCSQNPGRVLVTKGTTSCAYLWAPSIEAGDVVVTMPGPAHGCAGSSSREAEAPDQYIAPLKGVVAVPGAISSSE